MSSLMCNLLVSKMFNSRSNIILLSINTSFHLNIPTGLINLTFNFNFYFCLDLLMLFFMSLQVRRRSKWFSTHSTLKKSWMQTMVSFPVAFIWKFFIAYSTVKLYNHVWVIPFLKRVIRIRFHSFNLQIKLFTFEFFVRYFFAKTIYLTEFSWEDIFRSFLFTSGMAKFFVELKEKHLVMRK